MTTYLHNILGRLHKGVGESTQLSVKKQLNVESSRSKETKAQFQTFNFQPSTYLEIRDNTTETMGDFLEKFNCHLGFMVKFFEEI